MANNLAELMDEHIAHYGTLRRSGRYPWGSGGDLLSRIDNLKSKGLSEKEIAEGLNISTTTLREQKAIAKMEAKENLRLQAVRMRDSGQSVNSIANELGRPESSIRAMLKPGKETKFQIIKNIAESLKDAVAKFKFIDVGEGSDSFLGISETRLNQALAQLSNEGYTVHYLRENQLGTDHKTSYRVLASPDTEWKEVYANRSNITIPNHHSEDGGISLKPRLPVNNVDIGRIHVVYKEDGGADRDGMMLIRRGVDDISLGNKNYAQVRIAVNGTHYLKGMAVHTDNLPDGKDIVFYTNKPRNPDPLSALKPQKDDPDNPFGSSTTPRSYLDSNGVEQASAINLVYEQGDWQTWGRSLSSQFLSKQDPKVAREQLQISLDNRKLEFEEIKRLNNPVVREHLLKEFADSSDAAAVHLKAAAFPRQTNAVLLPAPSMDINEVYAPQYQNGDTVSLVRHPHGGKFEIPTLVVNNKNREMRKLLGPDAPDAIGVHPKVAQRLSGADFDGDTVFVAPNRSGRIRTSKALDSLKDFDPITAYPEVSGMKLLDNTRKQRLMGDVSNLITDMTIKGASDSEIARAVRHSMVVIDAEKHRLNWRASHEANGIAALKRKYQGRANGGASTIVSSSKSVQYVKQRKDMYRIDPNTGQKIHVDTNDSWIDKTTGNEVFRQQRSTKMYESADAHTLSSGTRIEKVYADYANHVKAIGDKARLAYLNTGKQEYSPTARKTYAKEVASLEAKLALARKNQPLERKAQLVAGEMYRQKLVENPNMSGKEAQSEKGRLIVTARARLGAGKPLITPTPREWEAIQMGAVTSTRLKRILRNSDMDVVKALATPRTKTGLSPAQSNRAKVLLDAGYTIAEVAGAVGSSPNLISSMDRD